MNSIYKKGILILSLFVVGLSFLLIYLNSSNRNNDSINKVPESVPRAIEEKKENSVVEVKKPEIVENKEIITKTITAVSEGSVLSVVGNDLILKIDTSEENFKIPQGIAIYAIEAGKPIEKTIADLKPGSQVIIEYNTENKEALAIKLVK